MRRDQVLVVGTNPEIAQFVAASLDPLRQVGRWVGTLLEASLRLAAEPPPVLIVLDGSLTAGEGLTRCRASRAEQPALPVLCAAEVLRETPDAAGTGEAAVESNVVAHDEWRAAAEEFLARGLPRSRPMRGQGGHGQVTVDSGRKAIGAYTVEWAGDLLAAGTALARAEPPDAMILAPELPDSDGLDFYRSVKTAHASIPMLLLAPGGTPAGGLEMFLATPVDVAELKVVVRRFLR